MGSLKYIFSAIVILLIPSTIIYFAGGAARAFGFFTVGGVAGALYGTFLSLRWGGVRSAATFVLTLLLVAGATVTLVHIARPWWATMTWQRP